MSTRFPLAVLGDGGWGTTLALYLHRQGHRVRWWGPFPEQVARLRRRRENTQFLPGVRLPAALPITADMADAVQGAELIVLAVPSLYVRRVCRQLAGTLIGRPALVSAAKGLEPGTLKRMTQVAREELGALPIAVLSGPNIAAEIARGHPASSVVASRDAPLAAALQRAFMSDRLRIYTSDDVTGVELGGALKNPIAIAAGISDGLGLGSNAKAALMTRGIAEMARLGAALGARPATFWGLSGVGDLVTTCCSGRNRWLGEQIGKGRPARRLIRESRMVFEGVETARAAAALARRRRVEVPIIEQVTAVLFRNRSPASALSALMRRAGKAETA